MVVCCLGGVSIDQTSAATATEKLLVAGKWRTLWLLYLQAEAVEVGTHTNGLGHFG